MFYISFSNEIEIDIININWIYKYSSWISSIQCIFKYSYVKMVQTIPDPMGNHISVKQFLFAIVVVEHFLIQEY